MGLGTPPQHDHSSPISPPKRTQPREMVSHSFHFVSDFTLGVKNPSQTSLGKPRETARPRINPGPALLLCLPPLTSAAVGLPVSLPPSVAEPL